MSTIQHLINGEMVSDSGRTADVYNPSTGKVIHQVPLASRETIQKAIDALFEGDFKKKIEEL